MGNGADAASASGRRCPKHPSEPPFTGFCSACLLDRLHAINLVGLLASPQPPPSLAPQEHLQGLDLEEGEDPLPPCSTATSGRRTGAGRTTLLHLFQLEDQGANQEEPEQSKAAPSTSGADGQDPPPYLQRKRSLRQSCSDWIACCDTSASANHSSCLPSRQSLELDASSSTISAAPPAPCTTSNGVAVAERRTESLRWNQVWAIRGFLARPAGHLLNRSFSESSRSRYAHHPGNGAIASSSSSQSQGIRLNGSHSVSSTGNGMDSSEISLPGDSVGHAHVHHYRPRLKNRLHWLRRSRSVHYSSPTSLADAGLTPFRSRSSSTRSTADKTQPVRRLNLSLFAAGFFGTQRHQH
ncbi:uncharacterized protein LOC133920743 [Phragmites australis]|uniref:uncharacterized protein LOC133920743 n=1 Tax=Phragmites australis TaxID=29695 RepID=UPI002D76FB87|nr:uncharacterized protein LOC133920743 [Phragmites australis]